MSNPLSRRSVLIESSYSDSSLPSSVSTINNHSVRSRRPPYRNPLKKVRKYNHYSDKFRDQEPELWYYQPRHSVSFISPWRPVDLNSTADVPIQEMTREEVRIQLEDDIYNQIKPNENAFTKFCCRDAICGNKVFPIHPEFLNEDVEGCFLFKIFMLKALQMVLAFGITFYFQTVYLTTKYGLNGEVEMTENYPAIEILEKYNWNVFIAFFLYALCWSITRMTILKFNTAIVILMFWIQTLIIIYIAFMLGVIWKLAIVSVFLFSLFFNYIVIGILPFAFSKFLIRKNCCCLFWGSTLSLLCLTLASWYLLTMILTDTNSKIDSGFTRGDIIEKLFMYWFTTFGAAEICIAMIQFDLKAILNGERFPVTQSSWMLATVYI